MAFDSENQPEKRKPRGRGKRSLMLEAIRKEIEGGEIEYLKQIIRLSLGTGDGKPNSHLQSMVLQRIEPPLKSTMPFVEFDFDEKSKPHEQAASIMKAVSAGKISPDVGHVFISSITSMLKIEEVTQIKKDIDSIKEMLGITND